jgi:translation initiation factor 3 subunit J
MVDKSEEKKIIAPTVLTDKWEGEDEDDVKDNWDDEDEVEEISEGKENGQVATQQTTKKKKLTKREEKALALKMKEEQDAVNMKDMTPEEQLAYKLEQQRLQEESDFLLAKEMLGVSSSSDTPLSSRHEYESFKKMIVDKLSGAEKSPVYLKFLEDLIRELCAPIEPDDIKKITSDLNALFNEKMKLQKVCRF